MSIEKSTTKMTDTATGTPIMAPVIMLLLSSYDTPGIAAVVMASSFCVECNRFVIAAVIVTSSSFCVEYDTPGIAAALTTFSMSIIGISTSK